MGVIATEIRIDTSIGQMLRAGAGVTLSQFSLLAVISEHGVTNQRQAAHFMGISPVAVKRQTDLALQQKLLEEAPLKNVQGKGLRLAPKGEAVIKRCLNTLDKTLSQIFFESDRQTDLMTHIDSLLYATKGAVGGRQRKLTNRRGSFMSVQIPKARKLYRGDINAAVIAIQKMTGFEINPQWWDQNVGNNGTSEEILDRFDKAYERYFGARIAAKQTS